MNCQSFKISVVIPSYKVKDQIMKVLERIPKGVSRIYVVDDCCPQQTGDFVTENCNDSRVEVIKCSKNQGVGGAVMTGYRKALEDGMEIVVKIDGDNQMDPGLICQFVRPIANGITDYTKGNRFFYLTGLSRMPLVRLIGNAGLSFVNKFVSGYWNVMDPTNGYTAIHTDVIKELPLEKISKRYFFESDMLYNLGVVRAVVKDVAMKAVYEDEESNLSVFKTLFVFPGKYLVRFFKRIFYNYFLRDFNMGSLFLIAAMILIPFGFIYGSYHLIRIHVLDLDPAAGGVIMMAALPIILGFQSLILFFQQELTSIPKDVIHQKKGDK